MRVVAKEFYKDKKNTHAHLWAVVVSKTEWAVNMAEGKQ